MSAQVDKERAKLHKWHMMTNKVESAFQKNLIKFQQEIKKRKERIQKFDKFTKNKKEIQDFKFLRLH